MGEKPKILVLEGFGLNCEKETAFALKEMGADARIVHFYKLQTRREKLEEYSAFVIPGGWSFGDDIAGGKVLANRIKYRIGEQVKKFREQEKPIVGICNGFQMLVKLGILPDLDGEGKQEVTLTNNASGKFEDRWIAMKAEKKSRCAYAKGVDYISAPVRHGEGRFIARDGKVLQRIEEMGLVAFRYSHADGERKEGESVGYPKNPNGAHNDIAGICDESGKVFGMMPHPECSIFQWQCPHFRKGEAHVKGSRKFYENIVKEAGKF